MWSCLIICPNCAYKTRTFTDGFNIQKGSFTVIFVRKSDKQFRIRVITATELKAYVTNWDTWEGLDLAIFAMGTAEEERVELPFGEDASFEAKCPSCGYVGLLRNISGLI
jgi:hypothetical protein